MTFNNNIDDEIEKLKNKNKVVSIKPLHVKHEGKTAELKMNSQYLATLNINCCLVNQ